MDKVLCLVIITLMIMYIRHLINSLVSDNKAFRERENLIKEVVRRLNNEST